MRQKLLEFGRDGLLEFGESPGNLQTQAPPEGREILVTVPVGEPPTAEDGFLALLQIMMQLSPEDRKKLVEFPKTRGG